MDNKTCSYWIRISIVFKIIENSDLRLLQKVVSLIDIAVSIALCNICLGIDWTFKVDLHGHYPDNTEVLCFNPSGFVACNTPKLVSNYIFLYFQGKHRLKIVLRAPVLRDKNGVSHKTTARETGENYLTGRPLRILNSDNTFDTANPFLYFPVIPEKHEQGRWRYTGLS